MSFEASAHKYLDSSELNSNEIGDLTMSEGQSIEIDESQINWDDPEHVKSYVEFLREKKERKQQRLKTVKLEIEGAKAKIEGHDESAKQAVLQVETLGMMTKYQLVFVKIETAFNKIPFKMRDLKRMQRAFQKMRQNAITQRLQIGCQPKIVYDRMRGSIESMA
jgi:hypothetical protein